MSFLIFSYHFRSNETSSISWFKRQPAPAEQVRKSRATTGRPVRKDNCQLPLLFLVHQLCTYIASEFFLHLWQLSFCLILTQSDCHLPMYAGDDVNLSSDFIWNIYELWKIQLWVHEYLFVQWWWNVWLLYLQVHNNDIVRLFL